MLRSAIQKRFACAHHFDFPREIVAITRAAKWAYFSTMRDDSLPLFQKLLPLEQTRQLTVRLGNQAGTPKPGPDTAPTAPDNNLDFL